MAEISPFVEANFGWPYGSSGWNTDMDQNLVKFSYLFDRNIDDIVSSLPAIENGKAYFLTLDNRLYFDVDGQRYSSPVPKWFVITDKVTGQAHQFDGINLNPKEAYPSLEDFGGKGDYVTDNLAAWNLLLASGAKGLTVKQGMYRFSDGISRPTGFKIKGQGAPILGFGTVDDKQYLRPGFKHLMPGSSFIFSGTGTLTVPLPQRIDEFATVRPCMRVFNNGLGSQSLEISGLAIIQDMDCFDAAGVSNKPGFESKSDYEVGLLLDDVDRTLLNDVVVFGYFPKAGTVVSSVLGNADPDYTTFNGGSTMGKHGLAELGSNNGPASFGLSGTRLFGTGLFTLDHHARGNMTTPERTTYYATADTWSCWYIDGDVDASSAEINGHYGYGVEMRTRANHALRLDHASNVQFYGGICELSPYGIPNSDIPTFIGSANVKRGVGFYGMRNNYLTTIFNSAFVSLIPVPVVVSGDPLNGRMGVFGKDPAGGYSGSVLGSDGNIGDAALQLTKDANDGSSGWRMLMDVSTGGTPLQWKQDGVQALSLTGTGSLNLAAPTGSDAAVLVTSNGGANVWAIRPQTSSAGQLQFRFGGSGSPVLLQLLTTGHLTAGSTGTQDIGTTATHFRDTYSNRYFIGTGTVQQISGTGTPEGVVTAPIGSIFQRSDGGAVTSLYVKESGAGNTGWVAK